MARRGGEEQARRDHLAVGRSIRQGQLRSACRDAGGEAHGGRPLAGHCGPAADQDEHVAGRAAVRRQHGDARLAAAGALRPDSQVDRLGGAQRAGLLGAGAAPGTTEALPICSLAPSVSDPEPMVALIVPAGRSSAKPEYAPGAVRSSVTVRVLPSGSSSSASAFFAPPFSCSASAFDPAVPGQMSSALPPSSAIRAGPPLGAAGCPPAAAALPTVSLPGGRFVSSATAATSASSARARRSPTGGGSRTGSACAGCGSRAPTSAASSSDLRSASARSWSSRPPTRWRTRSGRAPGR